MTTTDAQLLRHLVSWEFERARSPFVLPERWSVEQFVALVHSQRVTGVALAALDDDAVAAPSPELFERLGQAHVTEMQQVLTAECDLVRIARRLNHADVDFRVLKGLATAHLDHEDPALRSTSDVDLLVRPSDLSRAVDSLSPLLRSDARDGPPGAPDRFAKDLTVRVEGGGWLDLHQLVAPAYWGLSLNTDELFSRAESFVVAETEIRSLDRPRRLVHALLHAGYSDELSMHSVRDCLVLATALGDSLSAELDHISNRRIRGLLAIGARRTVALLGVEHPLETWAADIRPTARERVALRLTRQTGRGSSVSTVAAVPMWQWPAALGPAVRSKVQSSRHT